MSPDQTINTLRNQGPELGHADPRASAAGPSRIGGRVGKLRDRTNVGPSFQTQPTERRITVYCSRTSTGWKPRASYMERVPRKWCASLGLGSLWGYPSIHEAPRTEASAITRSSSVEATPCRLYGGAMMKHETPI